MKFVEPIRDRKKIESMKKILSAQSDRDYLLFKIGMNSAFRISDLISMQFKHVINKQGKALSHFVINEKKTGKVNKIALSKSVKKSVEDYARKYYSDHLDEYLFKSRKGHNKPISRVQAWQIIRDAAAEVGLENIGTHSLRKTFGYHQYRNGTSIAILMTLFNHSSESITLRYIGITQDDKDQAVQSLDL
ncbi:site-specific integrase [Bacillus atrophaeus]|nr:site-specific integrase [Bacillus atrophaeus]MCY8497774.1 site-specific integrase [Bacillus atrophaeus]MCY8814921.1 site-specific integrase [Bacillus atrophaeus]MCY8821533.1 site-specific integrase [Bacillus atrophaeus]MCY8835222.1 site-specific integrase [Bacillus atrophaeus]MEC0800501.1 site-specific integrase [Bacillus atrophaeus]